MLTERQKDVLKRIANGSNIKTIAGDMNLSSKTVEYHKAAAMREVGLRSDVEIAHYGISRLGVPLLFAMMLLLAVLPVQATDISLAWDKSDTVGVTNYILFGHTNVLTANNLASATIKANAGTNLTATVVDAVPGLWWFAAVAQKNGLTSGPSNVVQAESIAPPKNARTVFIEYGITITNTSPVGYFRLVIPSP